MNTWKLTNMLLQRTLNADGAFSFEWTLGMFQIRFENGQPVSRTQDAKLEQDAAEMRAWAEQYPMLNVTYPQTKTASVNDPLCKDCCTESFRLAAKISVTEKFIAEQTGAAFRKTLAEEWGANVTALTDAIAKLLRRHEFRTRRLFGKSLTRGKCIVTVSAEKVRSEIWMLPYSRFSLSPLLWDREICGMAVLLRERLHAVFAEGYGAQVSLRIIRNEREQRCMLIPEIIPTEEDSE